MLLWMFYFCKAMTMVRPKTLGEEKEDSEEEEEEIQIVLTSKDPNETSGLIRWTFKIFPCSLLLLQHQNYFSWNNSRKSFVKIKFAECMIDHLNIPSRTIEVESEIGKSQVSKFGIPDSFAGQEWWCGEFYVQWLNILFQRMMRIECFSRASWLRLPWPRSLRQKFIRTSFTQLRGEPRQRCSNTMMNPCRPIPFQCKHFSPFLDSGFWIFVSDQSTLERLTPGRCMTPSWCLSRRRRRGRWRGSRRRPRSLRSARSRGSRGRRAGCWGPPPSWRGCWTSTLFMRLQRTSDTMKTPLMSWRSLDILGHLPLSGVYISGWPTMSIYVIWNDLDVINTSGDRHVCGGEFAATLDISVWTNSWSGGHWPLLEWKIYRSFW